MQAKNQVTTETLKRYVRILLLGAILCAFGGMASAGEFNSSRGFFIDLPEGFIFLEGDGSSRFSFSLSAMSVDLLISDS